MKTETKPQPNESRYMTSDKKHYYLASVDENVQTLIKEQIDDLTRVLIDLKSQYDTITRDTTNKKKETEELCKKIDEEKSELAKTGMSVSYTNYKEEADYQNKTVLLISIFLYGFITVITLIGVTNIFNTITTNMNLRSKEFAMLK